MPVRIVEIVHMMIQRRASAAGIQTKISAHSFRATGITHVFAKRRQAGSGADDGRPRIRRTTKLYDRRNDAVELEEVERVVY